MKKHNHYLIAFLAFAKLAALALGLLYFHQRRVDFWEHWTEAGFTVVKESRDGLAEKTMFVHDSLVRGEGLEIHVTPIPMYHLAREFVRQQGKFVRVNEDKHFLFYRLGDGNANGDVVMGITDTTLGAIGVRGVAMEIEKMPLIEGQLYSV